MTVTVGTWTEPNAPTSAHLGREVIDQIKRADELKQLLLRMQQYEIAYNVPANAALVAFIQARIAVHENHATDFIKRGAK